MNKRARMVLAATGATVALAALAAPAPRADIRILAHRSGDLAPHRFQAAADLGIFAVSVLVTWSERLGR